MHVLAHIPVASTVSPMSRKPVARSRRLTVESLESRAMLAGNVGVSVVNGNLVVQGDEFSNGVTIQSRGSGTYRIVTFLFEGEPTRINGSSDNDQLFFGATADVNVTMAGGNDRVRLVGLNSPALIGRNLNVNCGAGDDQLEAAVRVGQSQGGYVIVRNASMNLGDSVVPKNLVVSGDSLDLSNVVVGGDVTVTGRAIDDSIIMRTLRARNLYLDSGAGVDQVKLIARSQIAGDVRILTGEGDDRVQIGSLSAANLTIDLGPFAPSTSIAETASVSIYGQSNIEHDVRITGSEERDDMTIDGLHAGDAFFAWLGDGNDRLAISNSSSPKATLRGGNGFDKLILGEGNSIDEIDQTGFE